MGGFQETTRVQVVFCCCILCPLAFYPGIRERYLRFTPHCDAILNSTYSESPLVSPSLKPTPCTNVFPSGSLGSCDMLLEIPHSNSISTLKELKEAGMWVLLSLFIILSSVPDTLQMLKNFLNKWVSRFWGREDKFSLGHVEFDKLCWLLTPLPRETHTSV